jgi:hypothetical protein
MHTIHHLLLITLCVLAPLSLLGSHCEESPDTLLPHFYGLYRVDILQSSFFFVVQKNVFASKTPIMERKYQMDDTRLHFESALP